MPSTTAETDPGVDPSILALAQLVCRAKLPPPAERRYIREAAGLPLSEPARALGVSQSTYQRWERGEVEPSIRDAVRLRALLDALRAAVLDAG